MNVPNFVEGDCVIGIAELYDTPLADIAWRGLERNMPMAEYQRIAGQWVEPNSTRLQWLVARMLRR